MEEFEKYYNRALRFLSYRPRSEKEVRDNLKRRKASEVVIETIIKKLKEQKFLNDKEFAKWWVEQRTVHRPKGVRAIKMEIRQKGVAEEIIENVIENQESGTLRQAQGEPLRQSSGQVRNQGEVVRRLIEQKLPRYQALDRKEKWEKLAGFLGRRGFDYDTIKSALDEVLGRDYNQQ